MLKLLHKPSPFLATIQPHSAFCSKVKREKMLRLRHEQKKLYGSVIKEKNAQPASDADQPFDQSYSIISSTSNAKAVSPSLTSEFHWLVKNPDRQSKSKSKAIKIYKSNYDNPDPDTTKVPKKPTKSPRATKQKKSEIEAIKRIEPAKEAAVNTSASILNPKSAIISAKNLFHEFMSSKHKPQVIPFDDSTLQTIVRYPLVCDKIPTERTEQVLANKSVRLPSISKVLQATMSESARYALKKWKLQKIDELGLDGFKEYERQTLERGKNFHSAIENYLHSGQVPDRDSSIIKLWDSIDTSLNQLNLKPVLLEKPIVHADLKYHGIIDNVSMVKDELCAFEWKTSEKSKARLTSTYDAPVQLCAYLGALNADPRYDVTVKSGCVVVAYVNGSKANVFHLSETELRKYWLLWLQKLQEYWIRVRDGTLPEPI